MGSRLIIALIVVLAAPGIGHLSLAGTFLAKAWLANQLIDRAWQDTLDGAEKVRPWPWADTWPVGELIAPRLGIRQIILLGDSARVLAFGPGLTEGLSQLGETGLSVVSGHRDTSFQFLQHLQLDDEIMIRSSTGMYRYRVEGIEIVDQRYAHINPQIDSGTQEKLLMLVTCFPFDALRAGGDLRYVVLAKAIHSGS